MIKAIDHIGIMVDNIQKSTDFYTDVLGFLVEMKEEIAEAGLSAVILEKNGSKIELMECRGKKVPKRLEVAKIKLGGLAIPIDDHLAFSVEDMESTANELKEKGIVFDLEPMQLKGGMKLASFKDPDGVQIQLIEYP